MPHIHGVAWIDLDYLLNDCGIKGFLSSIQDSELPQELMRIYKYQESFCKSQQVFLKKQNLGAQFQSSTNNVKAAEHYGKRIFE